MSDAAPESESWKCREPIQIWVIMSERTMILTSTQCHLPRGHGDIVDHEGAVHWSSRHAPCCGGTGLADYAAVPCPAPDCPVKVNP